jgi:hypothetical protein
MALSTSLVKWSQSILTTNQKEHTVMKESPGPELQLLHQLSTTVTPLKYLHSYKRYGVESVHSEVIQIISSMSGDKDSPYFGLRVRHQLSTTLRWWKNEISHRQGAKESIHSKDNSINHESKGLTLSRASIIAPAFKSSDTTST